MDFNEFKPKKGERYIIVEQGEPRAVILNYEDYQNIAGEGSAAKDLEEDFEPANFMPDFDSEEDDEDDEEETKEDLLEDLEEEPAAEEKEAGSKERVEELKNELKRELTIDDLPF